MHYFHYQDNELYAEQVSLTEIAKQFGTPCYVYSEQALLDRWQAFDNAFSSHKHRICYAVKANSNLAILNLFAKKNSGFDIVSQGELERVLTAQGDPGLIVFSGVGKTSAEIIRALEADIFCFNIESEAELERLNNLAAQKNKTAAILLRVNPNIDAGTHPYISTGLNENKFGIAYDDALTLVNHIKSLQHLKLIGIGCHIGSQITELSPFVDAIDRLLILSEKISALDITLQYLNIGGGLGINYQSENPPKIEDYAKQICQKLINCPLEIIVEPGRAIVAPAGILVTTVEYIKQTEQKNFAIIDAAMNDLLRPALYDAWHLISPVKKTSLTPERIYDIVGPVCESADFLGRKRSLAIQAGDLLAIHAVGAYGFSMSSNYNSRPRAAEVLVHGKNMRLIREREKIEDLFVHEKIVL